MMWGLLKPLLGGLVDTVGGIFKARAERKMLEQQLKTVIATKKIEIVAAKETSDVDWDRAMAEGSKDSWKDEYWTIVLSLPAIAAFFPGMSQHIRDGFDVLMEVPDWYRIALGTAIGAAFGRNEIIKWFKASKKEK